MADPYRILGVARDASPATIRSAYKRAVLECHPDRQNGESSRTMVEVQQAYETLTAAKSDPVEPDAALARWFAGRVRNKSKVTGTVIDETYVGSTSGLHSVDVLEPTWNHRYKTKGVGNCYEGQTVDFNPDTLNW